MKEVCQGQNQREREPKSYANPSQSGMGNTLRPPIAYNGKRRGSNSLLFHKRMCLQTDVAYPAEQIEDTSATTNFERINQRISKEIGVYIKWVDRFQGNVRPFYESIYMTMRKKLFDSFGKDIDVR
jgi:hypothetical protein